MWFLITNTYSQEGFVNQFSFASTIASIILSVLAIIMSISGEGKTETIRNEMSEAVQDMRDTVEIVKDVNNGVIDNLEELKKSLSELQIKIEKLPDNTAQAVYEKNMVAPDVKSIKVKIDKGWGINNEK